MLNGLHNNLLSRRGWYYKWHNHRFHKHIHYGVLGLFSTLSALKVLAVALTLGIIAMPYTTLAATKTYDSADDWGTWTKSNTSSTISSGDLTLDQASAGWSTSAIDASSTTLGGVSISKVSSSIIYTAYKDSPNQNIKYAKTTNGGTSWATDIVFGDNGETVNFDSDPSISAVDANTVYITAKEQVSGTLYYAKTTNGGTSWTTGTVVSAVYTNHAMYALSATTAFIVYYDSTDKNLIFAKTTDGGTSWPTTLIEDFSTVGTTYSASIYATDVNTIYISYYDTVSTDLDFAKTTNGGTNPTDWTLSSIDTAASQGRASSLFALDANNLFVSYYDITNAVKKLATSTNGGSSWSTFTITGSSTGIESAVVATDVNNIYVSLQVVSGGTAYVATTSNGGTDWTLTQIDSTSGSGATNAIALADANNIFMVYSRPNGSYSDIYLAKYGATYQSSGYASVSYDATSSVGWTTVTKAETTNSQTIAYYATTDTDASCPTADTPWTGWNTLSFSGNDADISAYSNSQYLCLGVALSTADSAVTPNVNSLTITYSTNATPTVGSLGPTALINGSSSNDTTPTVQFTTADTDGADTVLYQVQIDTAAAFNSQEGSLPLVDYTSSLEAKGAKTYTPSALGQGSYYWRVRVTDSNSATSDWSTANSGSVAFVIDTAAPSAPSISSPTNNTTSSDTTPTVSGTAEANSTVKIYDSAVEVASTSASGGGAFSVDTSALSSGSHTLTAKATDSSNNTSDASTAVTYIVDNVAPDAPVVSTPATATVLNADTYNVTGTAEANALVTIYTDLNNDGNQADGASAGTQQLTGGGTAYSISVALSQNAENNFVATTKDDQANESTATDVPTLTEDSTGPSTPSISSPTNGSTINDNTPAFSSSAFSDTYSTHNSSQWLIDDDSEFGSPAINTGDDATNKTSYTATILSNTTYYAKVRYKDSSGNYSSYSTAISFTIDTSAPSAPVVSTPATATSVNAANYSIIGTAEANALVTIYIDVDNDGTVDEGIDTSAGTQQLADGGTAYSISVTLSQDSANNFVATAKDGVSNESTPANVPTLTEDSTAPSAPSITSPTTGTRSQTTTPTIAGTAEANSTVKIYDGAVEVASTSASGEGAFSVATSALSEASHTITAKATDSSNNTSDSSTAITYIVDITAPSAPAVSTPATAVTVNAASYSIIGTTEANALVTVYKDLNNDGDHADDQEVSAGTQQLTGGGTAYSISVTLTGDSANNFTATAKDSANNESADANVLTITEDSTAPGAPTVSDPSGTSTLNANTYDIVGTAEANALVTIYIDVDNDGTVDEGVDTSAGTQQLADGGTDYSISVSLTQNAVNNFVATAKDSVSNESTPANVATITEDSTGPSTPSISSPTTGVRTNDTTPTFTSSTFSDTYSTHTASQWLVYNNSGCTSSATIDTGDDTSNKTTYTPTALSEGDHCVKVRYKDSAGNYSSSYSSVVSFIIDTTASSAPTSLAVAKASSLGGLTLTWVDPVASDLNVIQVYRSTTDGVTGDLLTTVAAGEQTYADTGLSNNTAYYYTLKATDTATNVSSATTQVSQTTHVSQTKLLVALPGQSFTSGAGVSGTAGTQTAGTAFTISVYGVDASSNLGLIADNSVAITSSDSQAVLPTDASLSAGTKTFSVTLKTAGSKTITATASGLTVGTTTATVSALTASSTTSALVAGDDSVSTGENVTLTATVKDVYSNPLSGQTVVLSSSRSGDSLAQPDVTSSVGVTSGRVTSSTAGISTITAKVGSTTLATVDITFSASASTDTSDTDSSSSANTSSSNSPSSSSNSSSSSATTTTSSISSSSSSSSDSSTPSNSSSTESAQTTAVNQKPVAKISAPKVAYVGQAIALDGSSSTDDVKIASYVWTFPDGSNSTQVKPTYIVQKDGEQTITLQVKDGAGETNTTTQKLLVSLARPVILSVTQQGQDVIVTGTSDPLAKVYVYVFSDPKTFSTTSDNNGDYSLTIPASKLGEGDHHITALAFSAENSDKSFIKEFVAETVLPLAQAEALSNDDVNNSELAKVADVRELNVTVERPLVSNRTVLVGLGSLLGLAVIGFVIKKATSRK